MIKPHEFPYITSLRVNDCYAYKDFDIVLNNQKPFSHLVLTGKNGSGKSTILRGINYIIDNLFTEEDTEKKILRLTHLISVNTDSSGEQFKRQLTELTRVLPQFSRPTLSYFNNNRSHFIYTFLRADRQSKSVVSPVSTVTKESDFIKKLQESDASQFFISQFKQYLVNKKVYQAFDQLDNNGKKINESEIFFEKLTNTFRNVFEDQQLELIFQRENFEFYLQLSDGRKLTFDVLSDGFSAFLSILMDLFVRVDLIRKQVEDYTYNPCGIVLIDEPETHLHLHLQYQVLPVLTELFPNLQFIVATHSAAVISSLKNVTVFNLTTKKTEGDEVAGKSFSELMVTHFGLDNEYSNVADEIFKQINQTLKKYQDTPHLQEKIKEILHKNEQFLSPAMTLELESIIAQAN